VSEVFAGLNEEGNMPSVTLPGGVIEVEGTPDTYLKGVVVQEA
jgi:hypothetical protein